MSATTAPHVPGVPAEHQPATGSAPGWPLVLYFHHVHPDVRHYTALTPREFALGMERVLEEFDPYRPADLLAPDGPGRPERPTVLVTFDDGYRDNLVHARPILRELGLHAVFFVCTGLLGQRSEQPREDYLTRDECDRLAGDGHLIAAHTRTHPHLDRLPPDQAQNEVSASLADIAAWYGPGPARLFAYPYGGIPAEPGLPDDALAFGTVRSPADPWDSAPRTIRRTYLPSGATASWDGLVRHWRAQWAPAEPRPRSDDRPDRLRGERP
ncbi:polysaccharide deacetylase family protein [Kitasatospora aureofaciens]|uniref:polysaccharide deacetylase family protein n=1 Tax=Kitasatospora aureofaciens TaxID=1894 RepID=UPI001C45D13E|nr:polysaccharide deacetylase family protein [Kitasatospora aureofaciens]MBV6701290.1 polysaccharide deacetylase family protein [Kitasatospora aureofaciens]